MGEVVTAVWTWVTGAFTAIGSAVTDNLFVQLLLGFVGVLLGIKIAKKIVDLVKAAAGK